MTNTLIEAAVIITMQITFTSMNAELVVDGSAQAQGELHEGLIFTTRNFAKKKAVSGLCIMLAGIVHWALGFPEDAKPSTLPIAVITRKF
ncbi:MAG: hypothetical protein ACJAVI_006019 [Candidatus Azotimanducaceae bacterium]|jgi:hypothetical protein